MKKTMKLCFLFLFLIFGVPYLATWVHELMHVYFVVSAGSEAQLHFIGVANPFNVFLAGNNCVFWSDNSTLYNCSEFTKFYDFTKLDYPEYSQYFFALKGKPEGLTIISGTFERSEVYPTFVGFLFQLIFSSFLIFLILEMFKKEFDNLKKQKCVGSPHTKHTSTRNCDTKTKKRKETVSF